MTDERFNPQEQDKLEQLIVEQLGRRKYMLDRMGEMEHPQRRTVSFYSKCALLAVAACLAVVFVFRPTATTSLGEDSELQITAPDMEQYRASDGTLAEIQELMETGDWNAAMAATEKALNSYEQQIDALPINKTEVDVESAYESLYYNMVVMELRWSRIYLLVKQQRFAEALQEIDAYLQYGEDADHYEEALQLQEVLTKK